MKFGLKSYTKLIIITSFIISFCLILFIAYNANGYINQLSENNKKLYASYKISESMKLFRNNIDTLGIYQRGYSITGDAKILGEYIQKQTQITSELDTLGQYLNGNKESSLFTKLKDLTYKKLMEGKDLSHKVNIPGLNESATGSKEGSEIVSDINKVLVEINNNLSLASVSLIKKSNKLLQVSQRWSYGEIVVGILAFLAMIIILFRDINVRNRLEIELRTAKHKADENAMLKEQFMANMSHEIRTPMNSILGFSGLMQKTKLDEAQTEYLAAIKSSGTNLLSLINDILDFSKIEAGMVRLEKIPFSIADSVSSLKLMFTEKAKEANIDFEIVIDDRIPKSVYGDPTRLTQILVNLTNNAIKFTNNGKVTVKCELKSIERNEAKIIFRITDTGIGIPSEKIAEVFERFNQGNSETTRKFGGTGLGLSIVKNLIEIQHGEITLKSKEGQGSEFTVIMNYPVSNEIVTEKKENNVIETFGTQNNKISILLVEDNLMNQKLASEILKGFGLKIDIAENGAVAIEKLKQNSYHLILMDMQMPKMDGYSASKIIRNELGLTIPIIAMTAHIMPGEKEKCLQYGMNDYISKPFTELELYNLISKYVMNISITEGSKDKETKPQKLFGENDVIVNMGELYEMAKGSNEFIIEMIELFLEQTPVDISAIETAIKNNDHELVKSIAHRMKTSVGFMGLRPLLKPLANMETLSETKAAMNLIDKDFVQIKSVCEKAIKELEIVLAKHVNSKNSK